GAALRGGQDDPGLPLGAAEHPALDQCRDLVSFCAAAENPDSRRSFLLASVYDLRVRPLRPHEQKKLLRLKRQRTNTVNSRHAGIVLLSRGGVANRDSAQQADCTPPWVRRIVGRFHAAGVDGISWFPLPPDGGDTSEIPGRPPRADCRSGAVLSRGAHRPEPMVAAQVPRLPRRAQGRCPLT